jgi:1,2-beta-oligoglucan phosphorylase
MKYSGGPQKYFQRAESSSFFGREIGPCPTSAMRKRVGVTARSRASFAHFALQVPHATLRQANCYYSSSDAAFADRYDAYDRYVQAMRGMVPLDGGWRTYSSGAGISTRLILCCFLGLRQEKSALVLDPAIPRSLDGLRVELKMANHEVTYHVGRVGYGPIRVTLNGADLCFTRGENTYRTGATVVSMAMVLERLMDGMNRLSIELG